MPGMDGKGPSGNGPSGRGMGNCRQNGTPLQKPTDPEQTPPVDQNTGRGMGQGNRGNSGAGRGGCRGGGQGRGGNR